MRLKQEWQKSPAGTLQTDGKNMVWFVVIERKLAKLSKTTLTYRSSSYFMFYPLFTSVNGCWSGYTRDTTMVVPGWFAAAEWW